MEEKIKKYEGEFEFQVFDMQEKMGKETKTELIPSNWRIEKEEDDKT